MLVHLAEQRGVADRFEVDSAGTGGWHVGEPPDQRMQDVAASQGVVMNSRARQVQFADFERFDLLICMDEDNLDRVLTMGAPPGKVHLLLQFHPKPPVREVPDPYYGGRDDFEQVFTLVRDACDGLLDQLLVKGAEGVRSPDA